MVIFHSYVSLPEGIPANGYSIVIKNMVRFRQLTMLTVDHEIWGGLFSNPNFYGAMHATSRFGLNLLTGF